MFKTHEREARIRIKRREINANKTTIETMKKTYIQPYSNVIVMTDALCSLLHASVVQGGTDKTIDNIDVVEGEKSETDYDWGAGSWGGE